MMLDECETVLVRKKTTTVRIAGSKILEVKQGTDEHLGIRVIHEKKILTAQTGSPGDGARILDLALQGAKFLQSGEHWGSLPTNTGAPVRIDGTFDARLEGIDGQMAADIAQEMINSASLNRISSISGSLNVVSETFELENSNGLAYDEKSTYVSGMINADSDVQTSGIGQHSCRTLDAFVPEKIGRDAARMCQESIGAIGCPRDEYSVILEPYSVGELLSFVIASNFGQRTYHDKRSCFSGMIGDRIASPEFCLTDDPHAPQGIGSKPVDDEGVPTSTRPLVQDGVFLGVFSNLYDGFYARGRSTGNGLRPGSPMGRDARSIPISAPHNLRVRPGEMTPEEMIRETRHGLLIGRLWYTYAVNPVRGDFSCTARSGIRIIENGQITHPVKPVRIIHNLAALLRGISGVANDERNVLQWASLPSITPSIRAEGILASPI